MITTLKNSPIKSLMQESDLSLFQRVLLRANGTVTAMLEDYLSEPIQVLKLSERLSCTTLNFPELNLNQEEQVISRKVLLRGQTSHCTCLYADSTILIENLDAQFSHELLLTQKPIGKLWAEQKVETFKEILDVGRQPANQLANHFCVEPESYLLFRTYAVWSQGRVTMIITEKFPESYFC